MTSGKPLLSSSEPPDLYSHPHLLKRHTTSSPPSSAAAAFDDPPQHTSSITTLYTLKEDELDSNFSPLRQIGFPDESVRHPAATKGKGFRSAELRFHREFQLECPWRERKRLVSWGGAMDAHHDIASFEVSSVQSQDKLNKSQRSRHKSMPLEDNLMHHDNPRLIHINDPKKTNHKFEFSGNEIRTSKYTILNFLPKNLFIQFHRVAYLYFLAIAALNQLPPLAVFGRTVSLFPLLFVLSVTAIKDGYEDWRRHRSDRNENNREALVLQASEFQRKRWKKMQAGEVVKICADESIPCDVVLLGTSDPSGIAYIQTMNLDGESNLKTRYARQETSKLVLEGTTISGVIRCEQPNRNIYEFTANMEIKGQRFPLTQSNIILRGCQLKNTEWAIGVVVYAGQETKAMLNSASSPSKRSRLETYMNRETFWLSVFLLTMHMYDNSSGSRFQCRSLNINEDLGQIRYVFSDKTGTLTENRMEFRRASVCGKSYGRSLSMTGTLEDTDIGGITNTCDLCSEYILKFVELFLIVMSFSFFFGQDTCLIMISGVMNTRLALIGAIAFVWTFLNIL
ncbi:unnamed protein product [Coffea canephora]|uniref:P-type ATPase N-terminal domain-containing protein n=1 Tax=Coffea canephora TaxID=49390 RepID=A0A068UDV0_COFCA|nr:unnamed protein product [Coffea canephora]